MCLPVAVFTIANVTLNYRQGDNHASKILLILSIPAHRILIQGGEQHVPVCLESEPWRFEYKVQVLVWGVMIKVGQLIC